MSELEKMAFVEREATRVSNMIGNRPYAFTEPVLRQIKKYVDDNAGARDLRPLYERGTRYAPLIVREFRRHGMHAAVGLYMAWIESLFKPGAQSGVGAGGMFQFMKGTAELYRLSPEDRFNPEKAAPAAAQYFANLIKRFGSNAISVPLAIAAYNRGEGNIMSDLQKVIDSRNRERSFWNLVEHADSLPTPFQRETISYVPKFFGAAIVGENPSAFGIDLPPLSTYE
jgi:membrane-bound lytic murein transglycosylase D